VLSADWDWRWLLFDPVWDCDRCWCRSRRCALLLSDPVWDWLEDWRFVLAADWLLLVASPDSAVVRPISVADDALPAH
jgi:hypothetical protein